MKFISNKEKLTNTIQVVQRAVSLKNPLPILSGIKFETEEERVSLTATDLDIGICCSFPAEILEPGAAVLPAKYIGDLVRRLPDLPIFFELDRDTGGVNVRYGQSEAVINGFPVEEFPEFPIPESEINFSVPETVLKEVIKQVVYAADTDENRPIYTGVFFEINGSFAQVVATDTHRLAWRRLPLDNFENIDINFLIPGKTLNDLSKIIGEAERSVKVTVAETQVLFATDDICLISRLIDGKFPSYRHVIPGEHISKARLKTRDLEEATERASLLARDGFPVVKMDIGENSLVVSINTEAGRVREEMPIHMDGEPVQIAFNARYLGDVLKVIGSEEVIMEFTGPLSPGIFRPSGNKEYFSLILPVRLR